MEISDVNGERIATINITKMIDEFEEEVRQKVQIEIVDNDHFSFADQYDHIMCNAFIKIRLMYKMKLIDMQEAVKLYAAVREVIRDGIKEYTARTLNTIAKSINDENAKSINDETSE